MRRASLGLLKEDRKLNVVIVLMTSMGMFASLIVVAIIAIVTFAVVHWQSFS